LSGGACTAPDTATARIKVLRARTPRATGRPSGRLLPAALARAGGCTDRWSSTGASAPGSP